MRLRHLCAGLAILVMAVLSGCYCPRACYRPAPCCPPGPSFYPATPACPCNGGGPGPVTAFSGGPPVVANPYHP